MTINFGVVPERVSFTLSSDADFFQACRTADGSDFPVAAVLEIRWVNRAGTVLDTWAATITDDTAQFNEDKALVAALLDDDPVQGRLFYQDGGSGPELLVAEGTVRDISP